MLEAALSALPSDTSRAAGEGDTTDVLEQLLRAAGDHAPQHPHAEGPRHAGPATSKHTGEVKRAEHPKHAGEPRSSKTLPTVSLAPLDETAEPPPIAAAQKAKLVRVVGGITLTADGAAATGGAATMGGSGTDGSREAALASPLKITGAGLGGVATRVGLGEVEGAAKTGPIPTFRSEPARRYYVWPPFICAIVIFVLVTGGLTYVNRSILAVQAAEYTRIQRQGNGFLDESLALIQEADSVVIALDHASESQITEEDIPRLEALLDKVESVQGSLDAAIERALLAADTFVDEEGSKLAQHAQDAATYRKQMLELSSEIVAYDIAAMRSALALEYAWTLIVEADSNMRSAVEEVNEFGAEGVPRSRDYNQEAIGQLTLAGETLVRAVEAFATVDVTPLSNYLEAKKASAEIALASDDAFLAGDYYDANVKNEAFIAKDAEAVLLAAEIPGDLLSLVVKAYEEACGEMREEYLTIRSWAADADAYLRAYLGVDVQGDG
jgi:hypothetical protein